MGFFDLFKDNNHQETDVNVTDVKEKDIMGMPASKFFADIYTLSTEKHINAMIPFFNDFMNNHSTYDTGDPLGNMAFSKGSIDNILQDIFQYYYYLFYEYVFSEVKKHDDIDYNLFKDNFSIEVFNQLDSTENYKSFLYENWDLDDSIEDLLNDMSTEMLDEDKTNPQFYKEICDYYDKEVLEKRVLLKEPVRILSPYIYSSDLIENRPPDIKVDEGNMILFFAKVFFILKCLPEDYECLGKEYHQQNSTLFNDALKLMIDATYNSFSIQTAVNQVL